MSNIGAEEFRQKVLDALKKVDSRYDEEDLFLHSLEMVITFVINLFILHLHLRILSFT